MNLLLIYIELYIYDDAFLEIIVYKHKWRPRGPKQSAAMKPTGLGALRASRLSLRSSPCGVSVSTTSDVLCRSSSEMGLNIGHIYTSFIHYIVQLYIV